MDFPITPIVEGVISRATVSYRLRESFTKSFPQPLTYMTMRDKFDNLLAERAVAAGATLVDGFQANGIELDGGASVRSQKGVFRGKVLVGADGANSVVAYRLGLLRRAEIAVALESEVYIGPEYLDLWKSTVSLDFGTIRGGYMWVFPKEDHLSIGVVRFRRAGPRLRPLLGEYLESLQLGSYVQQLTRGHRLPRRMRGMPIQSGNALLVGDAAGLIDFSTGEGICYALRSAQLAAPAICDYLEGKTGDLEAYEYSIDQELMPELHIARTLARIGLWFPKLGYTLMKNSDRTWNAACQLLRAEKSYHDFRGKMGRFAFLFDIAGYGT